ncbi:MAG: hypothetical protein AMXMBFR58_14740 [Phycisphaerae bacterium]|nr:hypothetical protein [Phycisphaerales bacterium]MCK6476992.1 hypothetical protein [Phycisphaerales bacterium]
MGFNRSRTLVRMLIGAAFITALPAAALGDDTASINLAGVQLKNATNQSRSSSPDSIDPFFGYEYHIQGLAKGNSGILAALFPNPTDLAVVLETLSPGSSAMLNGEACNASGAHPFEGTNITVSGSQVILGVTVNFSATVSVGIDASNHAYFSLTNVVLSPSILVGSLTITEGSATIIGVCTADFDDSGFVDTDDFDAFVAAFEAGDASADMDCTGFVDTDDFDAFVRRFEAGC